MIINTTKVWQMLDDENIIIGEYIC